MKIVLSYRERIAGLLLLSSLLVVLLVVAGAAIRNRWLDTRVVYRTLVERGEGLRQGLPVLLSGVQVGEVGGLTIRDDGLVEVELSVRKRHSRHLRQGTRAQLRRVLGIGEKRVHLVTPDPSAPTLEAGATLTADEPVDLVDALTNVDLGEYVVTLDRAMASLDELVGNLEEGRRLEHMIEIGESVATSLERIEQSLTRLDTALARTLDNPGLNRAIDGTAEVMNDPRTREAMAALAGSLEPERLTPLMEQVQSLVTRLDALLAEEGAFEGTFVAADRLLNDRRLEQALTTLERLAASDQLAQLIDNLSVLAEESARIGPEIPTATRELIATLREAVVVLKALQKTWLLKDEARDARREMRQE